MLETTAFNLPREVIVRLDERARRLGLSRSALASLILGQAMKIPRSELQPPKRGPKFKTAQKEQ